MKVTRPTARLNDVGDAILAKHVFLQIIDVRLSARLFDHPPEDLITEVRVHVARAGCENERLGEHPTDNVARGGRVTEPHRSRDGNRLEYCVASGTAVRP